MTIFSGAWPALVTPFTADDQVNVPVTRRLVDYLIDKGVGGFYVCGSTGEGVYMSVAERKLMLETVVEQVNGRVPVITHVGCLAAGDAAALAHHSQALKVDGVSSIIPPLYRSVESIHAYFGKICAAAPDVPFFTYIFGGPSNAVALMRALSDLPTLAGSKYTGPDMLEFRRIIELGAGKWTIFSGMDEHCLFAAMSGSSGNIGTTLNYHPGVHRAIHECVQSGDFARGTQLQLRTNQATAILADMGIMGALKAVMNRMGFDCGQPRLPNFALSADATKLLFQQLDAVGFDELVEM